MVRQTCDGSPACAGVARAQTRAASAATRRDTPRHCSRLRGMRLASLLVVVVACTPSSKQAPAPATQPVTSAGGDTSRSLVYASGEATFEGPAFKNACAADTD